MAGNVNNTNPKIAVVYKKSRYTYISSAQSLTPSDPLWQELIEAHHRNQASIDHTLDTLKDLGLDYEVFYRLELKQGDLDGRLVIAVGGDGTFLSASHFCTDSTILGINSDPERSIGAWCVADSNNFFSLMKELLAGHLQAKPINRLAVSLDDCELGVPILNDILFCHQNPASISRFEMSLRGITESHRSSGIWIASAAGSTGAIFSAGSQYLSLDQQECLFMVREPYWSHPAKPSLLRGSFTTGESLKITSTMTDAQAFIDGPHQIINIPIGQTLTVHHSAHPLWVLGVESLEAKRNQLVAQRIAYRAISRA